MKHHVDEYEPAPSSGQDAHRMEPVEHYCSGGFHPVLLGDRLGPEGRFEVRHKLGWGAFSTVWLCRDTQDNGRWRAVKILMANHSKPDCAELQALKLFDGIDREVMEKSHITLPLDSFWVSGPNGSHLCFVMPLLGAPTDIFDIYGHCTELVKDISFQLVQAMEFLHSHDICHGDFRPANILFGVVEGVDWWSEEQLFGVMTGRPEEVEVVRAKSDITSRKTDNKVPRYLVKPAGICYGSGATSTKINVVDFGISYRAEQDPEKRRSGIPAPYAAPESYFWQNNMLGTATDVWSLACTILQVCLGFLPFGSGTQLIHSMEATIGPLPEPYRTVWYDWEKRDREEAGGSVKIVDDLSVPVTENPDVLKERAERRFEDLGASNPLHYAILETNALAVNSREALQIAVQDYTSGILPRFQSLDRSTRPDKLYRFNLPHREAKQLFDLLMSVFQWDPAVRATARDLLEHPWFGDRMIPSVDTGIVRDDAVAFSPLWIPEHDMDTGEERPSSEHGLCNLEMNGDDTVDQEDYESCRDMDAKATGQGGTPGTGACATSSKRKFVDVDLEERSHENSRHETKERCAIRPQQGAKRLKISISSSSVQPPVSSKDCLSSTPSASSNHLSPSFETAKKPCELSLPDFSITVNCPGMTQLSVKTTECSYEVRLSLQEKNVKTNHDHTDSVKGPAV